MADTNIVARLVLNAKDFTGTFNDVLTKTEGKARSSGAVIANAFGRQAGEGVRSLSAEVPVLGSALTGLSGSALLAAGGIGALALAFGKAISITEEYEAATRQLDAVLKATGNNTGFSAAALKSYAEELETALAVPAEEILKAEQVLASFDGVAGSTFKRAIADAADLAAVYGGDLAGNVEKLGTVLQNLATGDIEGLRKGFKFLGVETLTAVEALAQAGKTAEAQELLLSKLEERVGGAQGAAAGGLSGAFFRMSDAIGDTIRTAAQASGIYSGLTDLMGDIAGAAQDAGDYVQRLFNLKRDGAPATAQSGGVVVQFTDQQKADLAAGAARDAGNARRAAEAAEKGRAEAAKKPADAAKKEADARERAAKAAADTAARLREMSLDAAADRLADVAQSFASIAADTSGLDDWLERAAKADVERLDKQQRAMADAQAEAVRNGEEQFRYLSDAFYDVFDSRSGDIWGKFKSLGTRTLAELAAQFALTGTINLGGSALGGLLGLGNATGAASGLASGLGVAGGLAGLLGSAGGSLAIGGAGVGTLTVGGSVIGGTSGIVGTAGSGLLGSLGGAGAAIGAAAPYLAAAAAAAAVLSSVLKKDPYADETLATGAGGSISVLRSKSRGANAAGLAGLTDAVQQGLAGVAAQLGGTVASGVQLGAIGSNKDTFYFDPSGSGFKAATAQKYKTADEAAAALISNAINNGAIVGVSNAVKNLLNGPGDLSARIAKAQALQSAMDSINRTIDPMGAAVADLNTQFAAIRDTMIEAGASAEDLAKASAAYDKQLAQLTASAGSGTAGLADFLASLKSGSGSPLALRDQETAARAAYEAARATIGTAGFDSAALISAGRTYIDVARAINGSTDFSVFNQVQADAARALAGGNVSALGENPFAKKTADASAATAENTASTAALLTETNTLLQQLLRGDAGGGFIGAARGFAV